VLNESARRLRSSDSFKIQLEENRDAANLPVLNRFFVYFANQLKQ
jgi:hypothetical protein